VTFKLIAAAVPPLTGLTRNPDIRRPLDLDLGFCARLRWLGLDWLKADTHFSHAAMLAAVAAATQLVGLSLVGYPWDCDQVRAWAERLGI
jgi:hypothetical protein